jgi:hypothetical protein
MLVPAAALVLALHSIPPIDSAAVYAPILEELRAEYPHLPIVLSETRSGVECMPHCGAELREPDGGWVPRSAAEAVDHSSALIEALRSGGLVDASCPVQPRVFGCADHPRHLFVALGEISARPAAGPPEVEGAVWVKVAILVPCDIRCPSADPDEPYFPDGFGLWYLLQPDRAGGWQVVRRTPAFFI